MTESMLYAGQELTTLVQELQRLCNQLLREVRRYGDEGVSTQHYLEQFKNFQTRLVSKQPLREIFSPRLMSWLGQPIRAASACEMYHNSGAKSRIRGEGLKPAIRRQLVLIQSHQDKCQQICQQIKSVEEQSLELPVEIDASKEKTSELREKLLSIYFTADDWLASILQIVEDILAILQNNLDSSHSPCISFQKSIISPDSHRRSALTTILESMNLSDKIKARSDPTTAKEREGRVQRKPASKFQILQRPVPKQIRPAPGEQSCNNCLLF